jgi:hypothetical protein
VGTGERTASDEARGTGRSLQCDILFGRTWRHMTKPALRGDVRSVRRQKMLGAGMFHRFLPRAVQTLISGFGVLLFWAVPAAGAKATTTPDFSGLWARMTAGFEQPKTGPGPIPQMAADRRLGDYNDPILKRQAADFLRIRDAKVLSGLSLPNPSSQCYPYPPPYILARNQEIQVVQQSNEVLILDSFDQGVRHVRLNQLHPAHVTPSWYGDSVGHYEGDMLVVDTIGIKVTPLSMVDLWGTPYTKALHLVERYRLISPEARERDMRNAEKALGRFGAGNGIYTDPNYRGRGLPVRFTVEDPGVFTAPWSALVTFSRASGDWPEFICAENIHQYYSNKPTPVPEADRPDF